MPDLIAAPFPVEWHANDEKRFEGETKVTFFDSNFAAYEEWRSQPLGYAATKPLRITAS